MKILGLELNKENIIGYGIQFIMIALSFMIMVIGGVKFLIISFIFFGSAGVLEYVLMKRFFSMEKNKISKKDKISKKIKNGFLWVHNNIGFIKKYNITIYAFKKIGFLPSFISYLIMLLYILIAFSLFKLISYYTFIIYILPIISNIYYFFKYHYFIYDKSKKEK